MIDVIIPAFNAHNTIAKTIDSIVNQTIREMINVYVVDDCSDSSYDNIVELYKDKINITLLRLEKNSGPGYARQYGIDHSNGKYLCFIDSDDIFFDENSLASIYNVIEGEERDAVHSRMREDYYGQTSEYCVGFDVLHSKIYRRSFIEEHNIRFPAIYNSEDLAFNNLCLINNPNIGFCDYTVYVYCRRKDSLTQTDDYAEKKHIKCYCESLTWVLKTAEVCNVSKTMIGKLIVSSFSYLSWYFSNLENSPNKEYVYSLIEFYDKYAFFYKDAEELYWLEYWTIRIRNENIIDNFINFVNECRRAYYNMQLL